MPKLTPIQWLVVAAVQLFYGFAVFALTRDYYQHQQVAAQTASRSPHVQSTAVARPVSPSGSSSAIPESVVQKDPILLAQLGDERFGQRQYVEAIRIYRQVLELNPDDVDTYNDLGLALHYSGDSTQALGVLKQGVEKDPKFQRIWLTLGFVQTRTAEHAEAHLALEQAVKLDPQSQVGREAKRMLDSLNRQ